MNGPIFKLRHSPLGMRELVCAGSAPATWTQGWAQPGTLAKAALTTGACSHHRPSL